MADLETIFIASYLHYVYFCPRKSVLCSEWSVQFLTSRISYCNNNKTQLLLLPSKPCTVKNVPASQEWSQHCRQWRCQGVQPSRQGGMSSHLGTPPSSHWTPPSSTHLRIRAFMSRSHDVRALSCPPSWSAWPLFVAGTRTRMSVPVIMPRMGDTWRGRVHQVRTPGPQSLCLSLALGRGTRPAVPSLGPGLLLWARICPAFQTGQSHWG